MQKAIAMRLGTQLIFETKIPPAPAQIQACEAKQQTIFQKDPHCAIALDFYRLGREILNRYELEPRRETNMMEEAHDATATST